MVTEKLDDETQLAERVARLERELAEARRQRDEGLAREAATGEILGAIAGSPADLRVVLDVITASAARLCEASGTVIALIEGDVRRTVAAFGASASMLGVTRPVAVRDVTGRAIRERRTVHVVDLADEGQREREFPDSTFRRHGNRTVLGTPLLRGGVTIGALMVSRVEARAFTDEQVRLLESFAAQAVIAIENARLFTELQERNRDLGEALDQQTATSEVLRIIASSPTDLQAVLGTVAEHAARLCGADDARISLLRGDVLESVAGHGSVPGLTSDEPLPVSRGLAAGRAVLDRTPVHIRDLLEESDRQFPEGRALARRFGLRTVLAVPLLRDGLAMGAVVIRRREVAPFTDAQVALLETFADQAVIAIENARLFAELQDRNRDLGEALEQQTATAEVLRVIASSPADLQAVLDTVVESAARLAEADLAAIQRAEGGLLRVAASTGPEIVGRTQPYDRRSVNGRAMLDGVTVHAHEPEAEHRAKYPTSRLHRIGLRAMVATPLMREGIAIGTLAVYRKEQRAFTERQIALLETFADQAVIAIENARLFEELQDRVEELRALGAVGQAVSATLDLGRVLKTVVTNADALSATDGGVLYEYDEAAEEFRVRATHRLGDEMIEALNLAAVRLGEGAVGQAALAREPVQVADITAEGAYRGRLLEAMVADGYRAVLAVPLLGEGRILGGLVVARRVPGEFPPNVVDLVRTFASQSALAIQNARLYRELEEKSAQLEAVSRHKSEFLANMSHELRTPLNAIIGFSEVLLERLFGEVNDKQSEYLRDILTSGQHLLSLINDILDLSKVEAGRMELELGAFSLREALENGLTMLRERASRHGITLSLDVEDGLDLIEADERKVKQVVFNLLSNAVKFTPDGGRVDVCARMVDDQVAVAVRDTGVGIAPDDLPLVFDEFRQVGQDAARAEGTGLGLALTRKLVELHGGLIRAESEVGVGSTLTFTLPQPVLAQHAEDRR